MSVSEHRLAPWFRPCMVVGIGLNWYEAGPAVRRNAEKERRDV